MVNTVDAVAEEVVSPQSEEVVEETVVESVESEVATDTPDEPVQSKEENAKYAEVRRKAEQAAQDKLIDEMYGKTHNIHSKAEYDEAMAKQKEAELVAKMKDSEDPETVKAELYEQWKANDPQIQEYEKIKAENYTNKQMTELNNDLKELGLDTISSMEDIANLDSADKVIKYVKDGKTLSEAYFLANKGSIINSQAEKVQQDTVKKMQANRDATPGSLANQGSDTLYTRDQVDAMTQAQVNANYDLVIKSMKTW